MPRRVLDSLTVHSMPHALYLGTFLGHDNKTHEAWANFEAIDDGLRIRLVQLPGGDSFPLNIVHGLKVLEIIDYRPSSVLGWVRFLKDDTGKFKTWKRGNLKQEERPP